MATNTSDRPQVLEKLSEFHHLPQQLKGPDLRGCEVVNPVGNVVGHVEDIFVDAATNEVRMAKLLLSGTHGRATREVLVPIEDLEILNEQQVRVRPVTAEALKRAS